MVIDRPSNFLNETNGTTIYITTYITMTLINKCQDSHVRALQSNLKKVLQF